MDREMSQDFHIPISEMVQKGGESQTLTNGNHFGKWSPKMSLIFGTKLQITNLIQMGTSLLLQENCQFV